MLKDEKEQAATGSKRVARNPSQNTPTPKRHKPNGSAHDTEVVNINQITIVGRKNALAGLSVFVHFMKADAADCEDPVLKTKYQENINKLKNTIDQLNKQS